MMTPALPSFPPIPSSWNTWCRYRTGWLGSALTGRSMDSGNGSSKSPAKRASSGLSVSKRSPMRRTSPRRLRLHGGCADLLGPRLCHRGRSRGARLRLREARLDRDRLADGSGQLALAPRHGAPRHDPRTGRRFRSPAPPRKPAQTPCPLPTAQPQSRRVVTGCILLVRHGETEWNLERRIQGRFDSPLTERGVAQAHAIGRLVGVMPDATSARIVASPLGRARRTAEIIGDHLTARPELSTDDRLREISVGSWDGLTYRDIETRVPGIFDGEGRNEWYFQSSDGDTYAAFAGRVGQWLSESAGTRLLVAVTHGIVSRVLRGLYARLPREIALTLPVPQDKIFRLSGGSIEEIAVPAQSADGRG